MRCVISDKPGAERSAAPDPVAHRGSGAALASHPAWSNSHREIVRSKRPHPRLRTLLVSDVTISFQEVRTVLDPEILPPLRPDPTRDRFPNCAGRLRFANADDSADLRQKAGKLDQKMRVHSGDGSDEHPVLLIEQAPDDRIADRCTTVLRDDDGLCTAGFVVSKQAIVLVARRRVLVIAGRVDSMIPAAPSALITRKPCTMR
jgi:hypothetical protein